MENDLNQNYNMPMLHKITYFIIVLTTTLIVSAGNIAVNANEVLFAQNNKYQAIKVTKILQIDTLLLENGEQIQLIGIKAPFYVKRKKKAITDKFGFEIKELDPTVSVEERAFIFLRDVLEGKIVRIEFDHKKKSEDKKTLGYVFLDKPELFINAELLRQGFAELRIYPPNTKHAKLLRAAYQEARREKRGLQGE